MKGFESRIKTLEECMREVEERQRSVFRNGNDDGGADHKNESGMDCGSRTGCKRNDLECNNHSSATPAPADVASYNTFNNITSSNAQLLTNLSILFPNKDRHAIANVISTHDTFDAMINTLSRDSTVKLTCKDVCDDLIQQDIQRKMCWTIAKECSGGKRGEANYSGVLGHAGSTDGAKNGVLNYPEVFNAATPVNLRDKTDPHSTSEQRVEQLRSLAQHYRTLYTSTKQLSVTHKRNKPLNNYYVDKAEQYKQNSEHVNRQAVIQLMKDKISDNRIDLHGLYVWEGLMVLSDYVRTYKFKRFYVCVGRKEKSLRMRPEVMEYLAREGFAVESEGAWLRVTKERHGS
ncbi:hypothetical protein VCUG_01557 [Vavraia culicis subsp. floridensis]|uniref:Smr domain-containing protein n=1 Tax=Vavraia culicis (isolate floridensis) TaxID=948595 RepID=L2GUH9_VAVCU|nr:uncharacterized protein VCUG_01557 [Vavraia culicis subsp. floridensis]ELA46938.1 hypothetical protein VCUG_01557 [Vavraia culicis subsp. floridensis]